MESESNTAETNKGFGNLDTRVVFASANKTVGGNEAARLNNDTPVGPTLSLKVTPGEVINMQAWSYYEGGSYGGTVTTAAFLTDLASAFGVSSGGGGEIASVYDGLDGFLSGLGAVLPNTDNSAQPGAYLNYILFDDNFKDYQHGYAQIKEGSGVKQKVSLDGVEVSRSGYIFVYVSMQSNSASYVHFDDLKVTHKHTDIVSKDDYYPFGLTFNSYSRPSGTAQNFKFGGKEEQIETGWLDFEARQYDPSIGRFANIDPHADSYQPVTPYNYAFNNPIYFTDPTGMDGTAYIQILDDRDNVSAETSELIMGLVNKLIQNALDNNIDMSIELSFGTEITSKDDFEAGGEQGDSYTLIGSNSQVKNASKEAHEKGWEDLGSIVNGDGGKKAGTSGHERENFTMINLDNVIKRDGSVNKSYNEDFATPIQKLYALFRHEVGHDKFGVGATTDKSGHNTKYSNNVMDSPIGKKDSYSQDQIIRLKQIHGTVTYENNGSLKKGSGRRDY